MRARGGSGKLDAPAGRPPGLYDGTFREEWEYVEGSRDLYECNRCFGVTPEYPASIHRFYITDDYPHIVRRAVPAPAASIRRS